MRAGADNDCEQRVFPKGRKVQKRIDVALKATLFITKEQGKSTCHVNRTALKAPLDLPSGSPEVMGKSTLGPEGVGKSSLAPEGVREVPVVW